MTTLNNYIANYYIDYLKLKRTKLENLKRDIGVLNVISKYNISDTMITEIKTIDIEELLLHIKKDRHVSEATINRYRSRLQSIFNHAIKKGFISQNPVNEIKRYKEYPRDMTLTYWQVNELFQKCKESVNKELYYVVVIALYTGMRYSEVLHMKKSRIYENRYYLKADETKSRKDRTVVINDDIRLILEDFLTKYPNNSDRIFKTDYIKRSFMVAVTGAGLKGVRFHDLRRTFATFLMENGTPTSIIQKQLGHSSLRMTEVYLSGSLKKSIDEINKLWFKEVRTILKK